MYNPHTLYIVIPCYNEEEVIPETTKRLTEKFNSLVEKKLISTKSRIVLVNDGSKDSTWQLITQLHNDMPEIYSGINLSRNRGQQNAILAGLMTVKSLCDVVITMDVDLQDDINAIDEMMQKYYDGNEVVYGVRSSRKKDTFIKKYTALAYYKFMKYMGADVVNNHAEYRLMSKRVLDELENFKEVNLFLRGMVKFIGFKHDIVYYERHERFAGESKYSLRKLFSYAMNSLTSFSVKPLKLITKIGILMVLFSIAAFIYAIVSKVLDIATSGWSSMMISIWLIGGLQVICLGIIGEYIGKIYSEVKGRPRFIVDEFLNEMDPKFLGDTGGINEK